MLPRLRESAVFTEVDDFIRKLHDGHIAISPEAINCKLTIPVKNRLGLNSKQTRNWADLLGWAVAAYQFQKDSILLPRLRLEAAYELLDYIERGRTLNLIKDGKNITDQLRECQEQNVQLKENVIKLEKECQRLMEINEELHKTLDRFGSRGTVGDTEVTEG